MLGAHSYWKNGVTLYGAGQKKASTEKARHGMDARVFVNKDSPDYKPSYGTTLTNRQKKILNEEIPLDQVRTNEIAIIIHKSEAMGDEENASIAKMLYGLKTHKDEFAFSLTANEAKDVLQKLTPWQIDWNKQK